MPDSGATMSRRVCTSVAARSRSSDSASLPRTSRSSVETSWMRWSSTCRICRSVSAMVALARSIWPVSSCMVPSRRPWRAAARAGPVSARGPGSPARAASAPPGGSGRAGCGWRSSGPGRRGSSPPAARCGRGAPGAGCAGWRSRLVQLALAAHGVAPAGGGCSGARAGTRPARPPGPSPRPGARPAPAAPSAAPAAPPWWCRLDPLQPHQHLPGAHPVAVARQDLAHDAAFEMLDGAAGAFHLQQAGGDRRLGQRRQRRPSRRSTTAKPRNTIT